MNVSLSRNQLGLFLILLIPFLIVGAYFSILRPGLVADAALLKAEVQLHAIQKMAQSVQVSIQAERGFHFPEYGEGIETDFLSGELDVRDAEKFFAHAKSFSWSAKKIDNAYESIAKARSAEDKFDALLSEINQLAYVRENIVAKKSATVQLLFDIDEQIQEIAERTGLTHDKGLSDVLRVFVVADKHFANAKLILEAEREGKYNTPAAYALLALASRQAENALSKAQKLEQMLARIDTIISEFPEKGEKVRKRYAGVIALERYLAASHAPTSWERYSNEVRDYFDMFDINGSTYLETAKRLRSFDVQDVRSAHIMALRALESVESVDRALRRLIHRRDELDRVRGEWSQMEVNISRLLRDEISKKSAYGGHDIKTVNDFRRAKMYFDEANSAARQLDFETAVEKGKRAEVGAKGVGVRVRQAHE